MSYQTLIVTTKDHVTLIQINRPQQLNALNSRLLEELYAALFEADHDNMVKCSVITGNEKAFAAGADIKEMADKTEKQMEIDDQFAPFDHIRKFKKPIIAAVSGFALGGGCELVMACDMIIAAENAKFGQPEINLGVIPGMGGSQRLTRIAGKYKAMELMLTGETFSADDALKIGLVNKVVPNEFLLDEAMSLAAKIASKPPLAVQAVKSVVQKSYEAHLEESLEFERQKFNSLFSTEDQKEGMKAFIEKRKPVWKGN